MRLSDRFKFVFVSNPRCASTSVRRMLDPFSDIRSDNSTNAQWAVRILRALNPFSEIMSGTTANAQWAVRNHASARQIEQGMIKTGRDPDNYVFFTTIRNPWARTFSAYKFGLKNPNSTWHIPAVSAGCVDGFVRHPHVIRQLRKHALDQMSTPRVHVFPIETSMESLVELVSSLVGQSLKLPHLNETEKNDYTEAFKDPQSINMIADIFASDIASAGYRYPSNSAQAPTISTIGSTSGTMRTG